MLYEWRGEASSRVSVHALMLDAFAGAHPLENHSEQDKRKEKFPKRNGSFVEDLSSFPIFTGS